MFVLFRVQRVAKSLICSIDKGHHMDTYHGSFLERCEFIRNLFAFLLGTMLTIIKAENPDWRDHFREKPASPCDHIDNRWLAPLAHHWQFFSQMECSRCELCSTAAEIYSINSFVQYSLIFRVTVGPLALLLASILIISTIKIKMFVLSQKISFGIVYVSFSLANLGE